MATSQTIPSPGDENGLPEDFMYKNMKSTDSRSQPNHSKSVMRSAKRQLKENVIPQGQVSVFDPQEAGFKAANADKGRHNGNQLKASIKSP